MSSTVENDQANELIIIITNFIVSADAEHIHLAPEKCKIINLSTFSVNLSVICFVCNLHC